QIAESLAAEAAEVKKNLSESTGKQRDVSRLYRRSFGVGQSTSSGACARHRL
ncbi:unnamed protein product, partial [Ectocarpus sp. 12 AP-2014]